MRHLARNIALAAAVLGMGSLVGCVTQQPRGQYGCQGGNAAAYTLVGGAVGGLVGNQFGQGSGKDAMTALGAVVGAVEGNKLARRGTRCY